MSSPSLSSPPGAPSPKGGRGNRPLTAVGVVIALGVVVVLAIGRHSGPAPVAAAAAAHPPAPAPAPVPQLAAEPPPPPPPEPEPVAPAPPEPTKPMDTPKVVGHKRPKGCEVAECKGTVSVEIHSALGAKAGQVRGCYERALSRNAGLQGKVEVDVRIGPTGEVCTASLSKDTLGDPAVTSCVLQRFRSGLFPKPAGGCVDTRVPINFVPPQ